LIVDGDWGDGAFAGFAPSRQYGQQEANNRFHDLLFLNCNATHKLLDL
jgi:hypothetical protein